MKYLVTILSLVSIFLTITFNPAKSKAADDIMHFYGPTFFGIATGIPRDFTISMAVGNEMIDRGVWTNPMGLPTPRLLFHFMGTPLEFTVNESGLKRGLAIATIKHPLFYNLLDLGMRSKDPIRLGAALHLLTDTFYHAGYSNLLGHGEGGHRPDMPYEEYQKAKLCLQAIIEVMYLIRDMQPGTPDFSLMERLIKDVSADKIYGDMLKEVTGAKDIKGMVKVISKRPDLFAQILQDHEMVRNSIFTNVERSDQYWKIAMKEILDIFKLKGYSKISEADSLELAKKFNDVSARTDLDPMDSLKIMIYRILQMQDPILVAQADNELVKMGFNTTELKDVLDKGRFDFSKLAGFSNSAGFKANIENDVKRNVDGLKILTANAQMFLKRISVEQADGSVKILSSHEWPQSTQTMAESIFPDILSWVRLFNSSGEIRLVEHRDLGNLVSSQTDTNKMRDLIDHDKNFLDSTLKLLNSLNSNPELLATAARLRALADVSYHLANNSTKDLFPGKLSPIKKVIYEDDSLAHACFAKECRVEAVKNLVIEMTNIKIVGGPVGFHTAVIAAVKIGLAKLGISRTLKQVSDQVQMINTMVRDYNYEIGFGTKDASGRITLPTDRPDVLTVSPNLTLAGYNLWTKFTAHYVHRIMLKTTRAKNKAIQGYILNGERMKNTVTEALNKMYYSSAEVQEQNKDLMSDKYGYIDLDPTKMKTKGLPGLMFRCEKLF